MERHRVQSRTDVDRIVRWREEIRGNRMLETLWPHRSFRRRGPIGRIGCRKTASVSNTMISSEAN